MMMLEKKFDNTDIKNSMALPKENCIGICLRIDGQLYGDFWYVSDFQNKKLVERTLETLTGQTKYTIKNKLLEEVE